MKKKLSPWSKEVKKAMIDHNMETVDLANKFGWTRQYTSAVINGRVYFAEPVMRISHLFGIDIPSENATLSRKSESNERFCQ